MLSFGLLAFWKVTCTVRAPLAGTVDVVDMADSVTLKLVEFNPLYMNLTAVLTASLVTASTSASTSAAVYL